MNGGGRVKSPDAYTEGAGTVFHPRKPGSQLSNMNPDTVLGLNMKFTSEGEHQVPQTVTTIS